MARTKGNTKKASSTVPVEHIKHQDKRVNIPTNELRGFMEAEESEPGNRLYPRDPSLDPQLVWKSKDEQDSADLSVPTVPVYIQEKIHPQAIIENLRQMAQVGEPEPELNLFGDFNGIKFEELIEFYAHQQNWSNRMILGDSLLVMNSLAEKENLKGKVQCIYIDPPYGIKFGSNWQVSTRKRAVRDGRAEDMTREPEQIRAFRDTWQLGIHSYLAYLRDRLAVSRELLTETGSVFVQIGDENVHLVRCLMDEVFGSENFCGQIAFTKTSGLVSKLLANRFDYLLWYAKDGTRVKYRQIYTEKSFEAGTAETYSWVEMPDGERRSLRSDEKADLSQLPSGAKIYRPSDLTSQGNPSFRFTYRGKNYEATWKTTQRGLTKIGWANRLHIAKNSLRFVRHLDDFPAMPVTNWWNDTGTGSFTDDKVYVVQTGTKTIERCLLMTTDPGDLVLDPTCGSGTTAYVAEQWGRRWITCDTSRVALSLARQRLMSARFPYYMLADSTEGAWKDAEITGHLPGGDITYNQDVHKGFVYKRVPHVTLKSIANNPDIKEGMTREEIDAAISRHADVELLCDQPYEDNKKIRVCGPFTMESLSPHRVLATEEERPESEREAQRDASTASFETLVLDNLKKAGVQNTRKGERLNFDDLYPKAGRWIQAEGTYTDAEGNAKRVAVSIGPEYGAVSPEQVREAAKEAVEGFGHEILIVCGYAFDPMIGEEARKYGRLTILPTKMNADLSMGDELLKKTGAGNLFMVFGEPDITLHTEKDGQLSVEIHGVDIYDPTTGEIRSSTTDEIACWFIDTNYNGESFFVRHAYFTGADEPYEKLKKALRAEIREDAWATLYSTRSYPFDKPATNKFAVKVINHYGDDVLKVFEVK